MYIKTLEARQDELREEYLKLKDDYQARAKLEELIDQLATRKPTEGQQNTKVDDGKPGFDPAQIESLVSNKIQEHESTKAQAANFNLVRSKLRERYGESYQSALKEQITELGITEDVVNDLARKHPQVLFKTLGLDTPAKKESFDAPPRSSSRFVPQTPEKRTWAYYQKMKKENPKLYLDPKTTVQMHNDAITLGDEFKDGDWGT
jgi:hypothetical protein